MTVEQIKTEFEKLSQMLSAWKEGEEIATIERDLALDKLKTIYDALRFENKLSSAGAPMPIITPSSEQQEADQNEPTEEDEESIENEVEVEFLFAEEDEEDEPASDSDVEPESEVESENQVEDIETPKSEAAAPIITVENAEPTPAPQAVAHEPVHVHVHLHTPATVTAPTSEPTSNVVAENTASVPNTTNAAENNSAEDVAQSKVEPETPAAAPLLFTTDEVVRKPRSKHQRMMSIYNEQPVEEKVVDISKIFDLDMSSPRSKTSSQPKPVAHRQVESSKVTEEQKVVTLADAIAPTTPTLADTLATPTPLAEEINNGKIHSLTDAIGINDKFLMIRDLFDGDSDAYNEAIAALDEFDNFDDCMIHIIDNYEWNPNSEGAKFIMQLLERKLS